jgi:hypothetical protein
MHIRASLTGGNSQVHVHPAPPKFRCHEPQRHVVLARDLSLERILSPARHSQCRRIIAERCASWYVGPGPGSPTGAGGFCFSASVGLAGDIARC